MYRDDPLDDEAELRELVGDEPVDAMAAAADELGEDPVLVALDALRLLQGWVDDEQAGSWFTTPQRRLGGHTPVEALCRGAFEEVLDVARAWAAAHG
jgi:hypothetical protein